MTTKYIAAGNGSGRDIGIVRVEGFQGTDKSFTCESTKQVYGSGPYLSRGKKRNLAHARRDPLHIFDSFVEARGWAVATLAEAATAARQRGRRLLAEADEVEEQALRLANTTEAEAEAEISDFLRRLFG